MSTPRKTWRRIGVILTAMAISIAGLVSIAEPAGALGVGTMCMFNAPSGAQGLGHVGWAFREGPTTHWFYGATERMDGLARSTWQLDGDQNAMFATFRDPLTVGGVLLHPAGYYTRWRCHETPSSAVGGALTVANQMKNNGYDITSNNCLTKSVAILSTYYGGDDLPDGIAIPPNDYFYEALQDSGWGPVHPLQADADPGGDC